jgi:hypothetical protein
MLSIKLTLIQELLEKEKNRNNYLEKKQCYIDAYKYYIEFRIIYNEFIKEYHSKFNIIRGYQKTKLKKKKKDYVFKLEFAQKNLNFHKDRFKIADLMYDRE